MPLLKCPDCGRDISDQAPVCPGCGRSMDGQQVFSTNSTPSRKGDIASASMTSMICMACGKQIRPDASFCGHCGGQVERACLKCGQPVTRDHAFCPGCGVSLSAEAASSQQDKLEVEAPTPPCSAPPHKVERVRLWRNPAFYFVAVPLLVAGIVVLTSLASKGRSQSSGEGPRAWDLVLGAEELDAVLDIDNSRNFDYRLDNSTYIGAVSDDEANSSAHRSYLIALDESEYLCIEIVLCQFESASAAQQVIAYDRVVHFDPSFETSAGQGNPFLSEEIDIAPIGHQSFCYQWSSFTPTIEFRVSNVQATVQTRIIIPSINRSYGTSETFEIALEVAEQQANRIQSVLNQ